MGRRTVELVRGAPRIKHMTSRRVSLVCVLTAVASIAILGPPPKEPPRATFRGLTAAQWECGSEAWDIVDDTMCGSPTGLLIASPRKTILRQLVTWMGLPAPHRFALLDGDPAARPVLIELLDSRHPIVRKVAIVGLCTTRPPAEVVMPRLLIAANDPDLGVRYRAIFMMQSWEPETYRRVMAAQPRVPLRGSRT